jgi:hypothetical protein
MATNTPPIRAPFFDAEVELAQRNPNLPPLKLAVKFLRTTREWANWAANMARGQGPLVETLVATASLNFPNVGAGATQDLTVAVPGALAADVSPVVSIGLPAGVDAGLVFHGFVSADNQVTVRATNATTGGINPAAFTCRVEVRRYA